MSSALAIAAVTSALKSRLVSGLTLFPTTTLGSCGVKALPPDQVKTSVDAPNILNLFLYQVTANPGWRNAMLPARDSTGNEIGNPPLALDLHFLMSAYADQDLAAEALLGCGMQVLHESPGISREQLDTMLGSGPFGNKSEGLAEQIEVLKITPSYLGSEELSKLWTAMQERYRLSVAYQVSVVLIQSHKPTRAALPVLMRGKGDIGAFVVAGLPPSLTSVQPDAPVALPAMRLGDTVIINGSGLAGLAGNKVICENSRAQLRCELDSQAAANGTLKASVPNNTDANNQWAVGTYSLSLKFEPLPGQPAMSNGVPIALAPSIVIGAAPVPPNFQVGDTMTITCTPRVLKAQESGVLVMFGSLAVVPTSIDTPATITSPTTITVKVPDLFPNNPVHPPTPFVVRLRVDGIDSLPLKITAGPPPSVSFDDAQKVTVQ